MAGAFNPAAFSIKKEKVKKIEDGSKLKAKG